MSLIISNITIHFLTKSEELGEVSVRTSEQAIEITPKISAFIDALHNIYNAKASKAYGKFRFDQTEEDPTFSMSMDDYLSDNLGFADFSWSAVQKLKSELEKYDLSETGYLVICHYELLGGRYLFVALLPISEHYYVDGELNISADKHLDTARLQLAVRIDLVDYQQNSEGNKYISYIRGRAGRKVSDFFLDFLGCEEGLNAKEQTQTLVQAVEDYVSVNQLDAGEKQQTRKELLSYCKEQKASSQDVSMQEVGKVIGHTTTDTNGNEQDFYQFCQQQSYPIEESFPHDQAVVNKITKYSGFGNGISLSFERSHFGQDVVYNPHNDSITIFKVPPNLKEQLQALLATNNEESIEDN